MSFLAGRLAATEGAYFLQESKHAVGRLSQKLPNSSSTPKTNKITQIHEEEAKADVLPEVLRHSLPSAVYKPATDSSFSKTSKWLLERGFSPSSSLSSDTVNPLRAFVSLPQVTFGPKRWQLPNRDHSIIASTANELRQDRYTPAMNPEKLKAVAAGLSLIAKAFFCATIIVFGGGTLTFILMASKLQLQNNNGIKSRGQDLLQPRFEMVRERLGPLQVWAKNMPKKYRLEGVEEEKEKPIIVKELAKILGARTSN